VNRASARFFLAWVRERMARVKVDDPGRRADVLKYHTAAEKFWQDIESRANADYLMSPFYSGQHVTGRSPGIQACADGGK